VPANVCQHLHVLEVLRDREERRGLHARGDGLADVDAARHDDAIDRRGDHRVSQVHLRLLERGACLDDLRLRRLGLRFRLVGRRFGGVEVGGREQLFLAQFSSAAQLGLRIGDVDGGALGVGLQLGNGGLGLVDLCLEERRVEHGDDLPTPHLRVEVGRERPDGAGDLRAHLDRRDRLNGAGRIDAIDDRAAADARRHRRRGRLGPAHLCVGRDAGGHGQHGRARPEVFVHDAPLHSHAWLDGAGLGEGVKRPLNRGTRS
jgi:hypothetical protein